MRINKYLAEAGLCSRRKADLLIQGGEVTINDQICQTGDQVSEMDIVQHNGRTVKIVNVEKKLYLYHKPPGIECTLDADNPRSIIHHLDLKEKFYYIGRLDVPSEGLLLLTNSREMVHQLSHPSFGHKKTYHVNVDHKIHDSEIKKMSEGLDIGDLRPTAPCDVQRINNFKIKITLQEGRKRQIRRMLEVFDLRALRLVRVQFHKYLLGSLKPGEISTYESLNQ